MVEPRRHRRSFNEPGHAHALTFSCYRQLPLLKAERTCRWLCDAIHRARSAENFAPWAFVFMPEHVHLLIHPREPAYQIARILHAIKQPVSRRAMAHLRATAPGWLPNLAVRRGAVTRYQFWQRGGGYDQNLFEPDTVERMIQYIHENPVRRGLVESASAYRWSSAAWYTSEQRGDTPLRIDPIPPEWVSTG